jgi:hypothetical protein
MLTIRLSLAYHEFTYKHTYSSPILFPGGNTVLEITISYPLGGFHIATERHAFTQVQARQLQSNLHDVADCREEGTRMQDGNEARYGEV